MDISLLSSLTAIHYDEGNLAFLKASLLHFDCGIQLQCTSGEGILSTGAQQFHLHKMSELIFWEGSIMQLIEASDDFHVRFLLYPKKLFLQAAISLDTTYFNYMREFPQYNHEEESWKNISLWMNMGQLLYPASFCIQRTAGTEFPARYADVDFQFHPRHIRISGRIVHPEATLVSQVHAPDSRTCRTNASGIVLCRTALYLSALPARNYGNLLQRKDSESTYRRTADCRTESPAQQSGFIHCRNSLSLSVSGFFLPEPFFQEKYRYLSQRVPHAKTALNYRSPLSISLRTAAIIPSTCARANIRP